MKKNLAKKLNGKRSADEVVSILRNRSTARTLVEQIGEINTEERTAVLSYSSEAPVLRWFGWEVLSHKRGAQNLERLRAKAPLLDNHDVNLRIGAVLEAEVRQDEKGVTKGAAKVKFSRKQIGEEAFQDVQDGILVNTSFRYTYDDVEVLERGEDRDDGIDVFLVKGYTPLEVSMVSIPADFTVGLARSSEDSSFDDINLEYEQTENSEDDMKRKFNGQEQTEEGGNGNGNSNGNGGGGGSAKIEFGEDAREAVLEMMSIAKEFGQQDLMRKFIQEGRSPEDFHREVLREMKKSNAESNKPVSEEIGMSTKEKRQYSLVNALRAAAFQDWKGAELERDISERMAQKYKKETAGFLVPSDLLRAGEVATSPAMTVAAQGNNMSGGAFVETSLETSSFIELLQNKLVIKRLGAQVLTNLRNNIAIPRQTGGARAYWVRERQNVTGSSTVTDQLTMSPKTVGAITDLSRKLLLQSSVSVNNFIINDFSRVLAREIDRTVISGKLRDEDGELTGEPNGILSTAGIKKIALGANGGRATYPKVVELETLVASANADAGTLAYLSNAKVRGALKTTKKAEGESGFMWEGTLPDGDGMVNGYRFAVTNMIPSSLTKGQRNDLSMLLFGNYADIVIGEWGVLEILVNPYGPGADNGDVRIRVLQDVDHLLRHGESFAYADDVQT